MLLVLCPWTLFVGPISFMAWFAYIFLLWVWPVTFGNSSIKTWYVFVAPGLISIFLIDTQSSIIVARYLDDDELIFK